jgi:hypothetical protein
VFPHGSWSILLKKWRTIYPYLLGPEGFGDGHYHVNFDEACPSRAPHWIDGWVYRTRVPYTVPEVSLEHYAPAICVGTGPKRSYNLLSSAFRRSLKYREIKGLVQVWPDILWV